MKKLLLAASLLASFLVNQEVMAGLEISPFASVSSTKKIKPADAGKEKSTTQQKTTYGLRASLSFFSLLKVQASAGQSRMETTSKTQDAVDTFDEIDYEKDMDMSTDNPEDEVKVTETERKARLGIVLDPGFWILIARAQAGVQATQRIVKLEQEGSDPTTKTTPITYKPYAGAGLGVKLSPRMKVMAEYNFFFYKFPEYEPFEREVVVSFIVAIGNGR